MQREETFRTLKHRRILVEKRMLLLIWNIMSRFECVDFKRQKKEEEEEIFHVPGNTFHREIDAGHDARKKETESASSSSSSWWCRPRRDAEFFWCFCLFFSWDCKEEEEEAYEDFSLISASSRRALWIPRGTTRGGLRCVMMYALLMFY